MSAAEKKRVCDGFPIWPGRAVVAASGSARGKVANRSRRPDRPDACNAFILRSRVYPYLSFDEKVKEPTNSVLIQRDPSIEIARAGWDGAANLAAGATEV
jgi:hypothetical protein